MRSVGYYIDLLKDRLIRSIYRYHSLFSGRGSAILMFHHIADCCPSGVSPSCYCSTQDFRELLNQLCRTKQLVSISELCEELHTGVVPRDKIVITFDDVPADVYYNAIPILRRLSVPYTLYISTSLIGMDGYLSEEQIVELSNDPLCTIGSHTVSHCMLKVKDADVYYEFSASQKILENMVGKSVGYFAYPYGTPFAISRRVIKLLENSKLYRSAVCTIPAFINRFSIGNMYSLPRIHSKLFINEYLNKKK